MKIRKLIIFLMLVVFLLYARTVFSYEAAVHPLITQEAVIKSKLMQTNYLEEQLGFGWNKLFNGLTVKEWIERGSFLEDNPSLVDGEDKWIRAPRHFYDPTRSPGRFTDLTWIEAQFCGPDGQYTSALEWAWDRSLPDADPYSWTDAQNYYYLALTSPSKEVRDQNFANTFKAIGQVLHLLQDMAVPAHVRNDNHLYIPPFERTLYGSDHYECYLTPKKFNKFLPVIQTAEAYELNTFNDYFGLADYTNYNYVSDDTILTENLPSDHVHYFAHPNLASTDFTIPEDTEILVVTAEDGKSDSVRYLNKVSDGETIDKFLGVSYFLNVLGSYPELWTLGLKVDDEVSYHYAEKLLPEAVGYSAGLIDYFFRGEMEATYDPVSQILTVKNKSGAVMDGTFAVFWDNEEGDRSDTLISWSANVPVEGTTQSPAFSIQSGTRNEIVVFTGTIDTEVAVVGKVGLPPPFVYGGFVGNQHRGGGSAPGGFLEGAVIDWLGSTWKTGYVSNPLVFDRKTWADGGDIYIVSIIRARPYVNLTAYNPDQYRAEFWYYVQSIVSGYFDAHNSGYEENAWYKHPEDPVVGTEWTGTQWIPEVNSPPIWNQPTGGHSGRGWATTMPKVYLFPK